MIFKSSVQYVVRLRNIRQGRLCVECRKSIPQGVRAYHFSAVSERKILSIFSAVWMCLSCGEDWGALGGEVVLAKKITLEEFADTAQIGFLKDGVQKFFEEGILKFSHPLVQDWVNLNPPRLSEAEGQPSLPF